MRDRALVIMDVQNDFCPGGALPVADADAVIPVTNRLIAAFRAAGRPIFATRDWHPADHCSFVSRGGAWPAHRVAHGRGAAFHAALELPDDAELVSKATARDREAYSGFENTDLAVRLERLGVGEIVVCGLATRSGRSTTLLQRVRASFRSPSSASTVREDREPTR